MRIFKRISSLFSKDSKPEADDMTVLDIVAADQEILDGCRLALHDICIRYDVPEIDSLVHETWRQLCGKLIGRLDGTKF